MNTWEIFKLKIFAVFAECRGKLCSSKFFVGSKIIAILEFLPPNNTTSLSMLLIIVMNGLISLFGALINATYCAGIINRQVITRAAVPQSARGEFGRHISCPLTTPAITMIITSDKAILSLSMCLTPEQQELL